MIRLMLISVVNGMSHIIIVKLERIGKDELLATNSDSRYRQRIAMTSELKQMLGDRSVIFAEARLQQRGMRILRRIRDRSW